MGLFGGDSSSKQTTTNVGAADQAKLDYLTGKSAVKTDAGAVSLAHAKNSSITINTLDGGAIDRAFSFASDANAAGADVLKKTLDKMGTIFDQGLTFADTTQRQAYTFADTTQRQAYTFAADQSRRTDNVIADALSNMRSSAATAMDRVGAAWGTVGDIKSGNSQVMTWGLIALAAFAVLRMKP